jgi:hypothetical protein
MKELRADHPALKGRTIFLKSIKEPETARRILQPASSNSKLSKGQNKISKGKWKGMPLYSLTLEERSTCPKTCNQWKTCYGNNMPFASRLNHTAGSFLSLLKEEVTTLCRKHPNGIVIRLHVLGDFYSVAYVNFWRKLLEQNQNLRIFGYTHRDKNSKIGLSIQQLNTAGAWIRWSDAGGPMSANVEGEGITCPEQTGKTASCMTCGLCWSTPLAINFLGH